MPTQTQSVEILRFSRSRSRVQCAVVTLIIAVTNLFAGTGRAVAAERPNVVLIFADDLGWRDTAFTGSDFYETPNLDRLAKQGMVFRQAYSSAGNCQPSRACLLSGQYTPRHHVFAVGSTKRGSPKLMRLEPVPNQDGLKPDDFTLAKAMKSAGYATGIFGKWHLSGPTGALPDQQGFDVVKHSAHSAKKGGADNPKQVYAITSAVCEFIETNKDRPFFAYVPHYAVHSPLEAREATLAKFEKKEPGKLHDNAKFAACIAELDTGVGQLLDKLKELGLDKNTLVAFTSDNGGTNGPQEPLRGAKGSYFEGGIREPMIVRWPGVVKPGTTCDVPVINVDFYATFAAVAGAKLPKDRPLDGADLQPLLAGEKKLDRDAIYWHFPGYLDGPVLRGRDPVFRTRPVSVVRKGDWKLFLYHEEWQLDGGRAKVDSNHAVELYNIVDDEGERRDLASSEPARRDELLDDLLAWMKRTDAPLPTEPNSEYQADAKATVKKKKKNQ